MTAWNEGYVTDIGYTYGYYSELNPLRLKLAFLNQGIALPQISTACELGFGQGLSVNFHAAASTIQWYGTDFNPSHASFAQELAGVSGAGAKLFDDAFADFCRRTDLPDFDYIGLHGIWSWISDDNRQVIVDFIRRKLKVGGVLYISYNTLPGWAAFAPMRYLMAEHAQVLSAEGEGTLGRIDSALDFADKLLSSNPMYARANPLVAQRMKQLKEQNRHYLAHEYFNRDWHPMYFAQMAKWLAPAKVHYACSAHYLDQVDAIHLTPQQQAVLGEIPELMFRQTVRDFMVNQQFRRDYWVKGARKLSALEQAQALRAQKVMLVTPRADVSLKVNATLGEATFSEAVYAPILDLLAHHNPMSLGQIEDAVKGQGIGLAQVREAIVLLVGKGDLMPVQDDHVISKAKKHTDKLNAHLWHKAQGSRDIGYLASPVTGGGVAVNRFQQLFLLAYSSGQKQAADWAQFAWQQLQAQGQRLVKDGKVIESAEDNLAELSAQAQTFADKQLPILKALQVV